MYTREGDVGGHAIVIAEILSRIGQAELEPRVVVLLEDLGDDELENAAVGASPSDHLGEAREIDAGRRAGAERFGDEGSVAHRDEVVDELGTRAGADLTHVEDVLAERFEHRTDLAEDLLVGSDHRVELARFGLGGATRKRCIT